MRRQAPGESILASLRLSTPSAFGVTGFLLRHNDLPGMQRDRKVAVTYTFPVIFKLK